MSEAVATQDVGEAVWAALQASYGRLKCAAKVLAQDAGTTPRTAENWLGRKCSPQLENIVALMAASPAINDAVQAAVRRRIEATAARHAAWKDMHASVVSQGSASPGSDGRGCQLDLSDDGRVADAAGATAVTVDRWRGGA